jgi:MoxR-like ATPase
LQDTKLIRLQCYEGLDASHAIYEWNYQRQLLSIRAASEEHKPSARSRTTSFPKSSCCSGRCWRRSGRTSPPVLLIDEIDRADEEFEAYLLEILSDFQITIPEIGTIEAKTRPHVILTANGARDLSDALRRRCLYNYVDYPDRRTEMAILAKRCPALEDRLAEQIVGFVQALRKEELEKKPGIAEMLDWAAALAGLGVNDLADDPEQTQATLVCLLKTERDRAAVPKEVQQRLVGKAA